MKKTPKILIVGTGAIGSYYGGKLAASGAHVSTLCRSDYDIVKSNGISIKSVDGDFNFIPKEVISQASDYSSKPDYVIVATKVLPGLNVAGIIEDAIYPETTIVLLQNGIDIEKPVANAFPENEIISALAFICANRIEYGMIHHMDYGRIVIGKYPLGTSSKIELLSRLLNKIGIDCQVDKNIITARWGKLIWNAPFNPISVLAGGVNTKEIVENKETLNIAINVMKEVQKLARSSGHEITDEFIQKNIDDTMTMKPYKTSMLLDFENKRPLEVEAILGNTVYIAKKFKISIPYIKSLYGLLSLLNDNLINKR
ncbi:ketopantoate reductase family protein [Spirochaetota bacterium]